MKSSADCLSRAAAPLFVAMLAVMSSGVSAQMHVQKNGDYILRASTVSAANLPPSMRTEHGIPSTPNTAVLNVIVQRQVEGALRNVPARLEVQASNLLGAQTAVDMRSVVENNLVSYLGTYNFLPREVLNFRITARPEGAKQSITLEFRDRLGPK